MHGSRGWLRTGAVWSAIVVVLLTGARLDAVTAAEPQAADRPSIAAVQAIAEEAYVYGFPMIAAYKAMYQFNIDRSSHQFKSSFNRIWNDAKTFTPRDTAIVTPNADTPYSMVQADLRAEPLVLCVPAVEPGRYYSVQLTDLYSFNYGYIGSRATGTGAGCYLVAGPDWQGETPAGIARAFRSETQFSLIIYRTQLFDAADIENVKKIQAGYTVQRLSTFRRQPAPPAAPAIDFPPFTGDEPFKSAFPAYLDFLLQFCPQVPEEQALRARFASIGIGPGRTFDFKDLSPQHQAAFDLGITAAYAQIQQRREQIGRDVNGWLIGSAFGDRAFFHGDYLLRAAAAMAGIYGNDAAEAVYPLAHGDATGAPLDGSQHRYTLTFAKNQLPPVNAFWSVTMYDGRTQLLIENPIHRYLINSPMLPDMQKNPDGSLTIDIQKDAPGPARAANWLPAPDGPIYLVMRLYWPKETPPSILPPGAGTWAPPGIVPVR